MSAFWADSSWTSSLFEGQITQKTRRKMKAIKVWSLGINGKGEKVQRKKMEERAFDGEKKRVLILS